MYISKTLDDTQKRYTVTEKEIYSIIYALKKFKPYIYARRFEIYTDHRALIWLCGKRDPCSRLGRWSQQISEYAQNVSFVAGKHNKVADALSRSPFVPDEKMDSMEGIGSNPCLSAEIKQKIANLAGIDLRKINIDEQLAWDEAHLKHAQETYNKNRSLVKNEKPARRQRKRAKDADLQELQKDAPSQNLPDSEDEGIEPDFSPGLEETDALVAALGYGQTDLDDRQLTPILTPELWGRSVKEHEIPRYVEQNEVTKILTYKHKDGENKLYWVPPKFRRDVLKSFHFLPTCAHPSGVKMYQQIKTLMNWYGMLQEVMDFVKTCEHCQRYRRDKNDRPEFQERRLPSYPMQRISMDFLSLESATTSGDFKVLVIIDDLTRYAEAFVTPNEKGDTAANVLMEKIICRYGVPEEIITDQGSAFISDLFETLCYQLAVDKIFTCAYHPQGNGINERMHSTLYTILRSLTGKTSTAWTKQLPMALYVYRTTIHKAIGMSPHKALYGYNPKHVALDNLPMEDYTPLDDRLQTLLEIHRKCKQHLQSQQERRNMDYNEKRFTREYEPGDLVKLRIHERSSKLSPFWKGPFKIIRKVNPVNYEVDIPYGMNMSRIIHLQHIRPWYSSDKDFSEISREIPEQKTTKISNIERKHQNIQHRPITRAYKKILDQIDQEQNQLQSVACIFNTETQMPERYLWEY